MPSLQTLGLKADNLSNDGVPDFGKLPEQMGAYEPPLPPGPYRFTLPDAKVIAECWDKMETQDYGTRIVAILPLHVTQAKDPADVGRTQQVRVSNAPRKRGKEGILVSDMDYLLEKLGETARPKTNVAYAQALQKHAGKGFGATVTYSWYCNPEKDIYSWDEAQQKNVQVPNQKGCGARYYQGRKDDDTHVGPNEQGGWDVDAQCNCGASIRAFVGLEQFVI